MSMTPETRARLSAFKEVKVKHPRLEEVDRAVMRAIDEHASYSQLMLFGPTGVGKSTVAKRITAQVACERHFSRKAECACDRLKPTSLWAVAYDPHLKPKLIILQYPGRL